MCRRWVYLALILPFCKLPWNFECAYPGTLTLLLLSSLIFTINSISTQKSFWVFAEYGDKLDCFLNPLYQRGYYKKNTYGIFFKSRYQILSYLQLILFLIVEIEGLWYLLVDFGLDLQYDMWYQLFVILNIFGWILLFFIAGFQIFYFIRYEKDYTYWENKEGIWQPFHYIFHKLYCEIRSRERLTCNYIKSYEETLEYIAEKRSAEPYFRHAQHPKKQDHQYELSARYHMENKNEICFFTKKEKDCLHIFQIAHIDQFEKEHFQKLDKSFTLFWKGMIRDKQEMLCVKFISIVMMDDCYQELKDRILNPYGDIFYSSYVRQKPGKERLFCFVTQNRLWVPWCYNRVARWQSYYEMVDELGDMVGIKRQRNGKLKFLDI